MQRLIEFLLAYRDHFLLLIFVIISNLLIFSNDARQLHQLRAVSFSFFTFLDEKASGFTRFFDAVSENEELRLENLQLSEEIYRLRSARLENIRLRSETGLRPIEDFQSVPADIIRKEIFSVHNFLTINAGYSEGVRMNSLVRTSAGVVGRVDMTSGGYSRVQLMISRQFRMAARLLRTNAEGIITWDGKSRQHVFLSNIVQTAPVLKGDPVVTSAFSTFAPEGIPIGIVDSVLVNPRELFKTVRVKTAVDFDRIDHVYVMNAASTDSIDQAIIDPETNP